MEYGENLILNPSAETGDVSNWQATNVSVITGGSEGTKCFKLASGASMRQIKDYLAFTLQPAGFLAEIAFKYTTPPTGDITSIKAFYTVTLLYTVADKVERDTFILPLEPDTLGSTGWITKQLECDTRIDAVLTGYDVAIYVDSTSPEILIDRIVLKSGLDGLSAHELNPSPHQLPLAITVGQDGLKATKGEEIMFWLKDTGDAIYNGEIKAEQITIGQITTGQIDIPGLDLLSNPTFSSLSTDVNTINNTVGNHATLIQQNSNQISLQATDISNINGTLSGHTSSISQLSDSITSKVSYTDYTGNTIASKINQDATTVVIDASKIDLTGITTIYNPADKTRNLAILGDSMIFSAGYNKLAIEWDTYISFNIGANTSIKFPGSIAFGGDVDFTNATVHNLNVVARFA